MQLDILLVRYGDWLVPVLAAAVCASALAASALHRAWRIQRGMRLFTSRLAGTRRGLHGAVAGDRVVAHGRAIVSGPGAEPFDGDARCAVASAHLSGQEVTRRAPTLTLRTALRRAPLLGEARLHAAAEERDVDDVSHALYTRLHDAGMRIEGGDPITLRHVRDGETILVLGRARSVASPSASATYRASAQQLAIGPDADGDLHVVGLGKARTHAWRIARVGLPLGMLGAAALLLMAPVVSMYAPSVGWSIPQSASALPHRLWLPLASPWRAQALHHASDWLLVRSQTPRDRTHTIELARALREVAPDCEREVQLVDMLGWDAREGAIDRCETAIAEGARHRLGWTTSMREPLRDLALAIDHGAELGPELIVRPEGDLPALDCPECGPLSRSDPRLDPWLVADVLLELDLRSWRMRAFRAAWLADLAILQAALDRHHRTVRAMLRASARSARQPTFAHTTLRATELARPWPILVLIEGGGPGEPEITTAEIADELRRIASALPPDFALRDHIERIHPRLVAASRDRRAVCVTLARLAVRVERAGAPRAARELARLVRRVASTVEDDSPLRSVVLSQLER